MYVSIHITFPRLNRAAAVCPDCPLAHQEELFTEMTVRLGHFTHGHRLFHSDHNHYIALSSVILVSLLYLLFIHIFTFLYTVRKKHP